MWVRGQEQTIDGSWPGTTDYGWFLARNQQQLLVPGQEPLTTAASWPETSICWFLAGNKQVLGSWPGTTNNCWFLTRNQQQFMVLARNHSQLLGPAQKRTFAGSRQKANTCWLLARNRQQLLVPGKEPLTIVGCWTGTTNRCRFLARSQQLLAPGQEPPTIVGSWL